MIDLAPGRYYILSKKRCSSIYLYDQTIHMFSWLGMYSKMKSDIRKLCIQTPDYEFTFMSDYEFARNHQDGRRETVMFGEYYQTVLKKAVDKIFEREQDKFKEVFDASTGFEKNE